MTSRHSGCAGANPKGQPGNSLSALVDIFTGVHKVSCSQPGTYAVRHF